jgi:CPA2 family monovalent cation:H+ antiporter-2
MVLALVLLPAVADSIGGSSKGLAGGVASDLPAMAVVITLAKVGLFVALALVVGTRVVPWLLMQVARTGSRELFTLAVLAVALGIAFGSAALFGVSFALGAFFAGVILSESELSHKAGEDSLPLKDAFAVLFFVSVGMLFDPGILLREPLGVAVVLFVIIVGKSLAALLIVLAFGHTLRTALTISASLAQIGEFSFILAGLGIVLGLLPQEGRDLVLAGALLSISLNPVAFAGITVIERLLRANASLAAWLERAERRGGSEPPDALATLTGHAIVIGHGRVGSSLTPALVAAGVPVVVIERDRASWEQSGAGAIPAVLGDATQPAVLERAGVRRARQLVVALPDGFQARRVLELAKERNPAIETLVRTHDASESERLRARGADVVLMGEQELARGMAEHVISRHAAGTAAANASKPLP